MISLPARLPLAAVALAVVLCGLSVLASAPTTQGAGNGNFLIVNYPADLYDDFNCNTQQGGLCTLREAILAANNNPGADTIIFAVSTIPLADELPFFTDPAGVIVDGTLGGDDRATIVSTIANPVDFGLVFTGAESVGNVTVKNLYVQGGFTYDAIQFCGKPSNGTCDGSAAEITLDNVEVFDSHGAGIDIFGASIYNVQITDVLSHLNDGSGIVVQSSGDLSGIHFTGGENEINEGDGYTLSGLVASNISFTGTQSDYNKGRGFHITADALSGLTFDGGNVHDNTGDGLDIDVVGSLSNVSVTGSTFDSNKGDVGGVWIQAGSFGAGTVYNNVFKNMDGTALAMQAGEISEVTVQNNDFADTAEATLFYADRGIDNLFSFNELTGNSTGIAVRGAYVADSLQVQISRNSISGGAYAGIDLVRDDDDKGGSTANDPGDADLGGNKILNFPEFTGNTAEDLTGTTCANCLVELFVADGAAGERGDGVTFLRDATADGSGNFSVSLCGLNKPAGTVVTSTATDPAGNTSEFSTNIALIASTPASCPTQTPNPTPTPAGPTATAGPNPTIAPGARKQGDLDCTGSVSGVDAVIALRFKLGLSLPGRAAGCPGIGSGSPKFGDVNCDGGVDLRDALAIVQFWSGAAIDPAQPGGCTALGEDFPA